MNDGGHSAREAFVRHYGGIYEHSPWVAEIAYDNGVDENDKPALQQALLDAVNSASVERKLALIRAHPDLAGRAAIAGELTDDSTTEQASAGIDRCTPAQYARLQSYNARYKDRFGFPFVMAVRGSNLRAILAAFEHRLKNDRETEFDTAIAEIHKIAALRLAAMDDTG